MGHDLSPFSAFHKWQIQWNIVSSNDEPDLKALNTNSDLVREALDTISKIGVIGGVQLSRLFLNNNKNLLKKMKNTKVIKSHVIKKNSTDIPVYTLGITGIEMTKSRPNEWLNFNELDVLQRLVFFQLYEKMCSLSNSKIPIKKTTSPSACIGTLVINNADFCIVVLRENVNEVQEFIKINSEKSFLVVCEDLIYLKPLNNLLNSRKVRVTTDKDLKDSPKDLFYMWHEGDWCKEREVFKKYQSVKAANVD